MISAKSITKTIQLKNRSLNILQNISFDITTEKITLLYGKSGSGKTTLLHILAGLDVPTSGDCLINNQSLSQLSFDDRATLRLNNIGVVYQFFNLIPNLTMVENITLPLVLNKTAIDHSHVMSISNYLGIDHILDQYPTECSGGELQRASFARALINRPQFIIADEPTGNLDSENRERLLHLIKQLSDDFDTLFLIATHDEQFKRFSSNILHIVDGQLTKAD